MPTCKLCDQDKNLSEFYLRKSGVPRKECKTCSCITKSKYYKENQNLIKEQVAQYKKLNPEKIKADSIKYYKNNRNKVRLSQQKYNNSPRGRLIMLMNDSQKRSKEKEFDLNIDFLLNLYNKQSGKCILTDIEFSFEKPKKFRVDPFGVSIDKINPKLSYTQNNVRLVCVAVNFALNEFGDDIFKKISEAYIKKLSNNVEKNI
jgi:hypothetical protein